MRLFGEDVESFQPKVRLWLGLRGEASNDDEDEDEKDEAEMEMEMETETDERVRHR